MDTKLIYIEKLAEVKGGLPARSMDDHEMGKPNTGDTSIPIEYNIEGYLLNKIQVNESVMVNRLKRNGIRVAGLFSTSRVTEVGQNYFKTKNSVYSYKYL